MFTANLRSHNISDILRIIGNGLRKGRLIIERIDSVTEIYCENNYITYIIVNNDRMQLGQKLLIGKYISQDNLNQIAQYIQNNPFMLDDASFAQALLDTGGATYEQIHEWSFRNLENTLLTIMGWKDGECRFEEGVAPPVGSLQLKTSISFILNHALQTARQNRQNIHPYPYEYQQSQIDENSVLDFTQINPHENISIEVTASQWTILTYFDGKITLGEIALEILHSTPFMQAQKNTSDDFDEIRYNALKEKTLTEVLAAARELLDNQLAIIL